MGGLDPYPLHYGANRHGSVETILNALNDGDGSALTNDPNSFNYVENWAFARAIADVWSANRRLSYQFDAQRMTDFLPRWEAILGLQPAATDTPTARRAAVAAKFSLLGQPATAQVVHDLMVRVLGSVFVGIVNGTSATETATVPGGVTIPGGVTLPSGQWTSSINYVAIQVTQPASVSDQQFYSTAANVFKYLDSLLPAWVDFGWFRLNSGATQSFLLDDPHNLDNEALS